MPINAPFFIKRYISNDLEQGALSRFFWYYPQDPRKEQFGGVGMFFEVTYSVSGDNYLEDHLVKLVWDFFLDAYYDDSVILTGLNRFKLAIKKSVQRLVSLIEESNLAEGIDVNIFYCAVVADPQDEGSAKVYLARVGEADVFLLRDGEYLSLVDIIPSNDLVQPIQAGVGELQKGDVVLFGNKELIGASLDSQMIRSESWHALLDSLQEFQTNLFGSKKIIVLGFFESGDDMSEENASDGVVNTPAQTPRLVTTASTGSLKERALMASKDIGKKARLWGSTGLAKIKEISGTLAKRLPTSLVPTKRAELAEQLPDANSHAEPHSTGVPERTSDSIPRDKSSRHYTMDNVDVSAFRRRRSASGRFWQQLQDRAGQLGQRVQLATNRRKDLSNSGKPLYGVSKVVQSPFQGLRGVNPTQAALIGVVILLGVFAIWRIWATVHANQVKSDFIKQIDAYTTANGTLTAESNAQAILRCIQQGQNLTKSVEQQYGTIADIKDKVLQDKSKEIAVTQNKCQAAFDQINDIVRVNEDAGNIDLITDFTVLIGDGSQVVDMAEQGGIIYVADKGKGAVYAFNTTNNEIVRLDDPNQVVKAPTLISTTDNKGELYVWDDTNGFLFYQGGKGFSQINVGTPELVDGKVIAMDSFGNNMYFSKADDLMVYRIIRDNKDFSAIEPYFSSEDFLKISDILVDGSIYVALKESNGPSLVKYFGGKPDSFAFKTDTDYELGHVSAGYTSIYENKPIYIFDQDNKSLVLLDKPSAENHLGQGVMIKRVLYNGKRNDAWNKVVELAVSRDNSNVERGVYLLDGTLLWRIPVESIQTP